MAVEWDMLCLSVLVQGIMGGSRVIQAHESTSKGVTNGT